MTEHPDIAPGDRVRFKLEHLSPDQPQRQGVVRKLGGLCDMPCANVDFEDGTPERQIPTKWLERVSGPKKGRGRA